MIFKSWRLDDLIDHQHQHQRHQLYDLDSAELLAKHDPKALDISTTDHLLICFKILQA